jgi:hypothetical protein
MQGGAEAASYSENALPPPPLGFTVHKAQLLNISNLKSSSSQQRNFHGYKVSKLFIHFGCFFVFESSTHGEDFLFILSMCLVWLLLKVYR